MENKFLNIIGIIAVAVSLVAAFYITKDKKMTTGIRPQDMDLTVRPGDGRLCALWVV